MKTEPLAFRMSPKSLDEYVGQEHITGKGKLLNRMIEADRITSIILFGPPGTGKTSIARIIANTTNALFKKLNAVTSGVKDIRKVVEEAQNYFTNPTGKCVLFIDEIHRFNKSQQDALLPFVEDGTVVLVGATTENPYFEVNKALISRSTVFMLKPLENHHIGKIIENALHNKERGYGTYNLEISDEAKDYLSLAASGDARKALNALELAVLTSGINTNDKEKYIIDLMVVEECIQKKAIKFDKNGEEHYNNISAFIKSMRNSDPDAAILYLARAIYAGESPDFLARRIMICASEDVGMANPNALNIAVSAANAVRMIGMPEARILLSHAAIAVASSPKSNACYTAIGKALQDVASRDTGDIPMHLRNAPVKEMKNLGYSEGYQYAHSFEGNTTNMPCLPEKLKGTIYYDPTSNGYEKAINEWLEKRRNKNNG